MLPKSAGLGWTVLGENFGQGQANSRRLRAHLARFIFSLRSRNSVLALGPKTCLSGALKLQFQ
jgi:hypothetical protein